MDHKWGRNITSIGLGDLGATMCSYVLGSDVTVLTNARLDGTDRFLSAQWHADTQTWATTYGIPKLIPGSNFPFGWTVSPDGPP